MDTKDRPGACVICHRDMIIEVVSDGKIIKVFAPYKTEVNFELNDGSRMPVCMCIFCRDNNNLNDPTLQQNIMNSVKEGWQHQVNELACDCNRPDWDECKAKAYMEKHNQYSIVRRIGDI